MTNLFFSLIKLSLGTSSTLTYHPSSDDWAEIYRMAIKQSLVGICFAGLRKYMDTAQQQDEKITISCKLYYQWLGGAVKIQQRNELMNQRCVELQSKFSSLGFKSSILKGQSVAGFYGVLKDLRQPGDIDVYIDCSRAEAIKYARSIGQKTIDWDYKHLHLKIFKDIETELHYRPDVSCNPFANLKLQRFWVQHKDDFFSGRTNLDCGEIKCPNEKMHIFFIIHHIYRHVISGGVGLRQVMDLYFALDSRNEAEDSILKEWVDKNGLTKISEALMWVLITVFGATPSSLPWQFSVKEGQFLLEEIMIGGNFGKADNRYGKANNRLAILQKIFKRNLHLIWHYGSDAVFAPIYYIWHFCWKRLARKY